MNTQQKEGRNTITMNAFFDDGLNAKGRIIYIICKVYRVFQKNCQFGLKRPY